MTCDEQYTTVCRDEFRALHAKLDRLDETLRGNSRVGLISRVDRLEHAETVRSRLLWVVASSTVSLTVLSLWRWLMGA